MDDTLEEAIIGCISSYLDNPPDSDFQRGYLRFALDLAKRFDIDPTLVARVEQPTNARKERTRIIH